MGGKSKMINQLPIRLRGIIIMALLKEHDGMYFKLNLKFWF